MLGFQNIMYGKDAPCDIFLNNSVMGQFSECDKCQSFTFYHSYRHEYSAFPRNADLTSYAIIRSILQVL